MIHVYIYIHTCIHLIMCARDVPNVFLVDLFIDLFVDVGHVKIHLPLHLHKQRPARLASRPKRAGARHWDYTKNKPSTSVHTAC